MIDYLLDNMDDEQVENELEDGYIIMTYEEFVRWCESIDEI